MYNTNELIGLEEECATKLLTSLGIPFKLEYYTDRKSPSADRKIVVRAIEKPEYLQLIVCGFQFIIKE